MEEFIQFSAKNKSEAITKACMELGTSSDKLDIQIVSEGSSGFFGIGAKPAIIKARRKVTVQEEDEIKDIIGNVSLDSIRKTEKKETPKKDNRNNEKKESPVKEKQAPKEQKPAKEVKEKKAENKPAQKPEKKETPKEAAAEPAKKEAPEQKEKKAEKEAPAKAKKRQEKPAKETKKQEKPEKEEKAEAPAKESAPKPSKPIEILTDEEEIKDVEQRAVNFLREVFGAMDLGDVEIKSEYNREEGSLDVDFEGEDMGVLIGKRGQTLDSLQYLTSLVVNKGKDKYIRVKLDTEDYRRRRKETLENLARGIAYKVKKTRRPVVLEPMNPYERRIIHSSLQGNKYVETVSEGEEPYRHIVVKPKRG